MHPTTSDVPKDQKNYGESLYHPHIHVRNVDWLKSALLYWDSVRRIVPENFPPDAKDLDLDPEIQDIIQARPDLLPRTPPNNYVDAARQRFLDCAEGFTQRATLPSGTQLASFRQTASRTDVTTNQNLRALLQSLLEDSRGGAEVDLWDGKMHESLSAAFRAEGLLRVNDNSGWVMVQKAAADLYMICLASVMSEKISAPLITYNPAYADVGKYLSFGNFDARDDNRASLLLELDLPFPSPEQLHDISLADIVDIHDATEDQRRAFRAAAEDLLAEASKAEGDEFRYEAFLNEKKRVLESQFRRHREKMESLSVKGFGSLLRIGAPTAVTSLVAAAGNLGFHLDLFSAGVFAGTGVVLSGMAWWGDLREQHRDQVEKFPYHYLLRLDEVLR